MGNSWGSLAVLALVLPITALLLNSLVAPSPLPLPPGPPGELFFGHTRVIPRENVAETYAAWSAKYRSDIIHLRSLGKSIIVLNSVEVARDLLDRRGITHSSRPRFTLLEVMGWGRTLTFMPFGNLWSMHRKLLQSSLANSRVRQWQSFQVQEARRTVANVIRDSSDWETSLRRFAVAIVLKVSYGVEVLEDDDPYIRLANDAMFATGNGGAPANSIVDVIPLARFLPDWLVRDWSLRFAREWRWAIRRLHDQPFAAAQADMSVGVNNTSMAHTLLTTYKSNASQGLPQEWTLEDIKGAAGAVFIAGADTTWATCVIFILNMVLHPDVQSKAQTLIDSVVGPDRVPNFDDRPSLPYIDFIIQEVYRLSPLAPLGIPHQSLEEDAYNGMRIPKGKLSPSTIYANARAMGRDERVYRDPLQFCPERYESSALNVAEPFPTAHFGFGRRICVGRFLADNSVWIMAATMLATLRIEKAIDEHGKVVEPRVEYTNGGTCHPKHFECSIRPRSPAAAALVTGTRLA